MCFKPQCEDATPRSPALDRKKKKKNVELDFTLTQIQYQIPMHQRMT